MKKMTLTLPLMTTDEFNVDSMVYKLGLNNMAFIKSTATNELYLGQRGYDIAELIKLSPMSSRNATFNEEKTDKETIEDLKKEIYELKDSLLKMELRAMEAEVRLQERDHPREVHFRDLLIEKLLDQRRVMMLDEETMNHVDRIVKWYKSGKDTSEPTEDEPVIQADDDTHVRCIFSTLTANALVKAEICTARDLLGADIDTLWYIKRNGSKTIAEIYTFVANYWKQKAVGRSEQE